MILLLCKRLSNTMPKLFFLFSSSKYHGTMLHSYGLTINYLTRIATQIAGIRGRYRLRWYSNCWESRVGWSGIPCAANMLSQLVVRAQWLELGGQNTVSSNHKLWPSVCHFPLTPSWLHALWTQALILLWTDGCGYIWQVSDNYCVHVQPQVLTIPSFFNCTSRGGWYDVNDIIMQTAMEAHSEINLHKLFGTKLGGYCQVSSRSTVMAFCEVRNFLHWFPRKRSNALCIRRS